MENLDSLAVFSVDSPQSHFCKGTVALLTSRLCRFVAYESPADSKKPVEQGSTGFIRL